MSEMPQIVDPWVHRFEELVALLEKAGVPDPEDRAANPSWLRNNIYSYRGKLGDDGIEKVRNLVKLVHG